MSKFELKLPRMGESVAEATLTTWLKEVGDTVELDEPIFEIATDKVDSEVPSEVEGVLVEKLFDVDDVIKVGQTVAIIEVDGEIDMPGVDAASEVLSEDHTAVAEAAVAVAQTVEVAKETVSSPAPVSVSSERFYSPLVKNIAKEEGITMAELDAIEGSGKEGRVTKNDILAYVEKRKQEVPKAKAGPVAVEGKVAPAVDRASAPKGTDRFSQAAPISTENGEIIEMSRMGKLIAKHMTESVATSAHVQSFIEVDVTNVVKWRNAVKDGFEKREGEKLTFTPIFMEAVAKALKKYPMMNISVDGDKVIKKKNINIGMAAALPDGNLIVPVIKNADQLNLVGMAKVVNDLAVRAGRTS